MFVINAFVNCIVACCPPPVTHRIYILRLVVNEAVTHVFIDVVENYCVICASICQIEPTCVISQDGVMFYMVVTRIIKNNGIVVATDVVIYNSAETYIF